jgi:RimJ/RimL family protein N-acetyltransferase
LITTERLILRPWNEEDFLPYAQMNADPQVREFFPSTLTREESDAEIWRFQAGYARDGFGLCAAEIAATGEFAGMIGLETMTYAVPSLPQLAVELGWRLAPASWGKGLATEGARAVIRYAFETLQLTRVFATTVPANVRSRRVMEKTGMKHLPALDFDHPFLPEGHPLRRHVLYVIERSAAS